MKAVHIFLFTMGLFGGFSYSYAEVKLDDTLKLATKDVKIPVSEIVTTATTVNNVARPNEFFSSSQDFVYAGVGVGTYYSVQNLPIVVVYKKDENGNVDKTRMYGLPAHYLQKDNKSVYLHNYNYFKQEFSSRPNQGLSLSYEESLASLNKEIQKYNNGLSERGTVVAQEDQGVDSGSASTTSQNIPVPTPRPQGQTPTTNSAAEKVEAPSAGNSLASQVANEGNPNASVETPQVSADTCDEKCQRAKAVASVEIDPKYRGSVPVITKEDIKNVLVEKKTLPGSPIEFEASELNLSEKTKLLPTWDEPQVIDGKRYRVAVLMVEGVDGNAVPKKVLVLENLLKLENGQDVTSSTLLHEKAKPQQKTQYVVLPENVPTPTERPALETDSVTEREEADTTETALSAEEAPVVPSARPDNSPSPEAQPENNKLAQESDDENEKVISSESLKGCANKAFESYITAENESCELEEIKDMKLVYSGLFDIQRGAKTNVSPFATSEKIIAVDTKSKMCSALTLENEKYSDNSKIQKKIEDYKADMEVVFDSLSRELQNSKAKVLGFAKDIGANEEGKRNSYSFVCESRREKCALTFGVNNKKEYLPLAKQFSMYSENDALRPTIKVYGPNSEGEYLVKHSKGAKDGRAFVVNNKAHLYSVLKKIDIYNKQFKYSSMDDIKKNLSDKADETIKERRALVINTVLDSKKYDKKSIGFGTSTALSEINSFRNNKKFFNVSCKYDKFAKKPAVQPRTTRPPVRRNNDAFSQGIDI